MALNYLLVSALLLLALCVPRQGAHLLRFLEKPLGPLGRRPIVSAVLIGGLAFIINAALSIAGPMPVPRIHDEFSNLLLADTLAHGRLSNPAHPLWVHFESHHIIQLPTYPSKYPVALGLMMAIGQVLSGRPIVGVWLSGALACGAVYWMLRAWLRPRWAVLGGLLAVVHPTMLLWSQGYWGGAVAVLGG